MPDMKRREFIALVGGGGLLAAKVKRASAQQPAKLPTIGYLGASTPSFDITGFEATMLTRKEDRNGH